MISDIFARSGGPSVAELNHLGGFAEVLRADGGWRDHTQRLRSPAAVVIEPVNGAPRNAEPARVRRLLVSRRQSRSALRRYRRSSLHNGRGCAPALPDAAHAGQ